MNQFINFGDVSPFEGQTWIRHGGNDFAECVAIYGGDICGLADNQLRIERGSIYFSPRYWNAAIDACYNNLIGPLPYLQMADCFYTYIGMDNDYHNGVEIVQFGVKRIENNSWVDYIEADTILHGNTNARKYILENVVC